MAAIAETPLDPVFRIILHVSPSIDLGVTHWTEAPECPVANEVGQSEHEAVERTKEIIRTWWKRETGESGQRLEFVLLQGN
jgi:predicted RNase H-like HicB family nuclease